MRDRLILLACSLLVLAPGMHVSLFDRDEGWYGQVVREMLASGDWLVPTYLGEPWLLKPPLVYWLAAGLAKVFGLHEWVLRAVSVGSMCVAVQLVATLGARLFDVRTGRVGALIFVTAGLPALIGRMFLMDSLLLVLLLGAAVVLERMWRDRFTARRGAAFWMLIGVATLTKGPAIAVYVGGMLGACWFAGGWVVVSRWAFWASAPLGFVAPALWFAAVAMRAGGDLWQHYFMHELFSRFSGPVHGHVGPPGYYAVFALLGLAPWTVAGPRAVMEAWRVRRVDAATAFVLWWLVLPWAALELVPGKLPHYWLPCYAPPSLLIARLCREFSGRALSAAEVRGLWAWAGTPIVVGLVLVGFAIAPLGTPFEVRLSLGLAALVLIVGAVWALRRVGDGDLLRVAQRMGGGMVAGWAVLGALVLPAMEPYRLSRQVAEAVNELDPAAGVLASGFDEPTLFFYLGRPAQAVNPKVLAQALAERGAATILVLGEKQAEGLAGREHWEWRTIRGLQYVRGRMETVWIGRPHGGAGD
ncbi:MAG: glycosyltransferase family 39 protein [Phycisphaerae bacterium]|nr:glycosyltransferase family 39 protein [Phycisphaerae bacterium]